LRRPGQARDRPAVRVGLLQLVEGAVDDELAEFLEPGLDLEISRERDPLVLRLETEEGLPDPQRVDRVALLDLLLEAAQERPLEPPAEGDQLRAPLPAGVDPGE